MANLGIVCTHTRTPWLGALENKLNLINLSFIQYAEGFCSWHGEPIHSLTLNKNIFSFLLRISNQRNLLDRFCRSDKWLKRACKIFKVYKTDDHQTIGEEELHELFEDETPRKDLPLCGLGILVAPI